MLPAAGIDLEIVPRKNSAGTAISASRVRELLRTDDISAVKELVPESTFLFLLSAEGGEIIQKIRSSANGLELTTNASPSIDNKSDLCD